jgi:hypothetical protein
MKINRKEKLIEQLRKTPVVEVACKRQGIARATYYRWKKEDPQFAEKAELALQEGSELINDMAESKLISLIQEGNLTGIIFWLKNRHKKYSPKLEVTAKTQTIPLTEEQKKLIQKSLMMGFANNKIDSGPPDGQTADNT